jgi:paraquat-inducible protein A
VNPQRHALVRSQPSQAGARPLRRSLRTIHPRKYNAAAGLIVLSSLLFFVGVLLPCVEVRTLLTSNQFSILSGIETLLRDGNRFLAALILAFSVVFPACKLLYLYWIWVRRYSDDERHRKVHMLATVGKWSMLDVFVIAQLVVLLKLGMLADARALPGIYLFAASVLLSMFATGLTQSAAEPRQDAPSVVFQIACEVISAAARTAAWLKAAVVMTVRLTGIVLTALLTLSFAVAALAAVIGTLLAGPFTRGVVIGMPCLLLAGFLGQGAYYRLRRDPPMVPYSPAGRRGCIRVLAGVAMAMGGLLVGLPGVGIMVTDEAGQGMLALLLCLGLTASGIWLSMRQLRGLRNPIRSNPISERVSTSLPRVM